jgi:rare lipoprotein A (peptidoglycan hydrolase)
LRNQNTTHRRSLKVAPLTAVLACLLATGVEITASLARPHPTDLRSVAVAFARATKADFRSASSGMASVYHGGVTATGERLNVNAMTAAHKTLPFGSMVTVAAPQRYESTIAAHTCADV